MARSATSTAPQEARPERASTANSRRREMEAPRVRCYNCQEFGTHLSRNCPKVRRERCIMCREEGHSPADCPREKRRAVQSDPRQEAKRRVVVDVKMVSSALNKTYQRRTIINGESVKVYIDTGCERNLMASESAERLGLSVTRSSVFLRGFGSVLGAAHGKANFTINIDDMAIQIRH